MTSGSGALISSPTTRVLGTMTSRAVFSENSSNERSSSGSVAPGCPRAACALRWASSSSSEGMG